MVVAKVEALIAFNKIIRGSGPKPGTGCGRQFPRGSVCRKSGCHNCGRNHLGNPCPAQNSTCYACNRKGHWNTMCQTSRRTSHSSTQPKVVQDVHAQDQNTGKTKNVDIVKMIWSMGLHECQAKRFSKCTGDGHCL